MWAASPHCGDALPHHVRVTISLVSAPVLGFDLVRHPRGAAVADIVLWALSLGPADLAQFRARLLDLPAGRRGQWWDHVHETQAKLGPGALRGSALRMDADGPGSSLVGVIEGLRRSLIVDLDDMDHLIRNDVLAWAGDLDGGAAADLVLDWVAAEWVDGLDPAIQGNLAAGARAIRAQLGERPHDVGPCRELVHDLLATLRGLGPDGCARLRTVNTLLRPGGSAWAQAVHEASWAALTTGRIRAAASAQLLAAQAFVAGGLDPADGAEGVWNLISGHVQACVVSDVLAEATQASLARGWRAAMQPG